MVGFIDQIEPALFEVCDARARVLGLFSGLEPAMGRLAEAGAALGTAGPAAARSAHEESRDEQ